MTEYNENIPCDGIDSLRLNIKGGNITFHKIEGNNINIKGSLGNLCKGFTINNINGEINIRQIVSFSPIKIGFPNSINLAIGIPSDLLKSLVIKHDLGNLNINDVNIKEIEIRLKAAKLLVDDILCDYLNVRIGTKTANISLNRKCGDIKIHSLSGKFDVKLKEVGGDLKCTAGSGGGNIKIPRNSKVKISKKGVQKCEIDTVSLNDYMFKFDLIENLGGINLDYS